MSICMRSIGSYNMYFIIFHTLNLIFMIQTAFSSIRRARVAVVGSAMTDLTCYARELPLAGQTLVGEVFTSGFGGKGANQAVMAAHCGAQVFFIGMLGNDLYGITEKTRF